MIRRPKYNRVEEKNRYLCRYIKHISMGRIHHSCVRRTLPKRLYVQNNLSNVNSGDQPMFITDSTRMYMFLMTSTQHDVHIQRVLGEFGSPLLWICCLHVKSGEFMYQRGCKLLSSTFPMNIQHWNIVDMATHHRFRCAFKMLPYDEKITDTFHKNVD